MARDGTDEASASSALRRFLPRYTEIALEAYEQELISEGALAISAALRTSAGLPSMAWIADSGPQ